MLKLYLAKTDAFCGRDRFLQGCSFVDSVRLEKIHACKTPEDKVRSLCCGLLLQYALDCALSGAPCGRMAEDAGGRTDALKKREICYGYGKHGKPYFPAYPGFHFSLSHSGGYAGIAFSDRAVGMDIQQKRPLREAMADRVLSGPEHAHYGALDTAEEKDAWFFRCWCAKESYLKLTGSGLSRDLKGISYEAEKNLIREIRACGKDGDGKPAEEKTAYCKEYVPAEGYFMNVCTMGTAEKDSLQFPEAAYDATEALLKLIGAV